MRLYKQDQLQQQLQLQLQQQRDEQKDSGAPQESPQVTWDIDLRAETPIYKGGSDPEAIDADYPFRGTALRGQLRGWWRATVDATSVRALRAREHALFGGVFEEDGPRASRVALGVTDMASKAAKRHELRSLTGSGFDYALWVDRGHDEAKDRYHVGARGQLSMSLQVDRERNREADRQELDRALRALILMGGAGSRSRRGMGRLWSDALLGRHITGLDALQEKLDELAPRDDAQRPWPSLAGARAAWLRKSPFSKPGAAVEAALQGFKELRGMRAIGGQSFDGSQRLREAQRDWLNLRARRPLHGAFTAALGMPLTYRSSNNHLPGAVQVRPKGHDRLPSPIHIRPVPTRGGWAAVIIALRPWFTGPIESGSRAGWTPGSLDPEAVDKLLAGMATRGWDVAPKKRRNG